MSHPAGSIPQRMSVANLASGDVLGFQYNPAELDEEIAVVWTKLQIPGLSHTRMHYARTENHAPSFTLSFDAMSQSSTPTYDIQSAKRWLMSLCYSPRSAGGITDASPPDALFVWPGFMSLRTKIQKLKFKTTQWTLAGLASRFTVAVEIEEARDVRLYSEDVLALGTIRPDMGQIQNRDPGATGST